MSKLKEIYFKGMNNIKGNNWIKDFDKKDDETLKMINLLDEEINNINELDFNDKEIEELLVFRISYKNMGNFDKWEQNLKRIVEAMGGE